MDIFIGSTHSSNSCGMFKVVSIASSKSVSVEFIDTGFTTNARFDSIRSGAVKDKLFRSVHGVGFLGDGEFLTSCGGINTDAYLSWQRMIGRCYDTNYINHHLYADCTVCDEWQNFQMFAAWYMDNYPNDGGKYHLDKDIKIKGNRTYSPLACSFVLAAENISAAHEKAFSAVDPYGVAHHFVNLAKFCRANGLNKSNMHKVLTGKNKSCKGWVAYAK